ncbi:MAG: DUF3365 domain-containing protein [Campylobacterota bacterium]|nr:DUF3365 domain-containing protein [Campylobacterota bacterium]
MGLKSFINSKYSLILFTILFFITTVTIHTYHSYLTIQEEERKLALSESKLLTDYMFIHRQYYINLYSTKVISLDEYTLKGLPAYSAYPIAKRFSKNNNYGIKIKLASDRPRNKDNQADKQELKVIDYFNKNKDKKEYFEFIKTNNSEESYYQYGFSLKVKQDCLVCHTKPQNAPKFIRERYTQGYGYSLGDIRGIISIKIPKKHTEKYTEVIFKEQVEFNIIVFIILFIVAIFIILNKSKMMKELEYQTLKANKANKAKSEFLANMSHEIRTPLNAIVGFVDLLKEDSKGRKSLEYVEVIDKASDNLLKVIEDILDFSKIESGKLDIDKTDFDVRLEFEVLRTLFNAKCSSENINLIFNIDKNLPEIINTDPLRLKQIVANLLSNAIKFSSYNKNIIVDVKYINKELYISVEDEGKGISSDKLEHIFESFSQEDTTTTREYGGSGLGLTISSELVSLLGGDLKVDSILGKGSKFYFSIPITIGVSPKKKDDKLNITFNKEKVLLVEDNQANQIFMKVIFKKLNLEFDIANDGLEAIDMFKKNKYNIILMDENMPNMNGIEATTNILKLEKEKNLEHTIIIALTANALKGDREKFLNSGMDDYLSKPVKKDILAKVLAKFLK